MKRAALYWLVALTALPQMGCDSLQDVADDLGLTPATVQLAIDHFDSPQSASLTPTASNYVNNLFGNLNNAGVDVNLGLPHYTYYQGMIVSKGNAYLAGQVRVVGGLVAVGNVSLAGGSMVTTNPESQLNRIQVTQARWKVESWIQE
jgi:hypothetical protein